MECPSLYRRVDARRGLSKKRRHECGSKEDDRSIVHMLEGRRRKTHGYGTLCKISLNKTGARFNNSLHQGGALALLGIAPHRVKIDMSNSYSHQLISSAAEETGAAVLSQSRCHPSMLPQIKGLDYYGESRRAEDVRGDFFDFVPLGDQALAASLGEAPGTGISAAILMSGLRSVLRGLTADGSRNITTVVQQLNRAVYELSPDIFFPTLFYARIEPRLRRLQYVSAGHDTAFLVRKDTTRLERLERTGTVLGLTNHTTYGRRTVSLDAGDVLIAFTDGIAEVADTKGWQSCETSICDVVRRHAGAEAREIVGLVVDAVERLTGESRQGVDRTVIAVRYRGDAAKALTEAAVGDAVFSAA